MKILVTGGAGYLGSVLVPEAIAQGHEVRVLDRLLHGRNPLAELPENPSLEFIRGDIRRLQEHPGLFEGVDAVIHLAAIADEAACQRFEALSRDVNVASTVELARLAAHANVRRFVFASTWAVYAPSRDLLLNEDAPCGPRGALAAQKLDAEEGLAKLATDGFEPVIARLGALCGSAPGIRYESGWVNQAAHYDALDPAVLDELAPPDQPSVHVRDATRTLLALATLDCIPKPAVFNVSPARGPLSTIPAERERHSDADREAIVSMVSKGELGFTNLDSTKLLSLVVDAFSIGETEAREEVGAAIRSGEAPPMTPDSFTVRRLETLARVPVSEGGEPAAPNFLPLTRPVMDEEEEQAVLDTFRSGWITSGPQIGAFEKAFARAVSAPHAVATISCTAALHLCLIDAGVRPGDEVITTPITWASTGNTLLHMGAKPVFVDIEPDTLNIDPAKIEAAITPRTKAIMPVHMAGQPCDLDAIDAIAGRNGLAVVEDAAHALGARYRDRAIGEATRYSCFSFYAIKNITTIEGGAIATNDEETAQRLRLLASNGMSATAWDRYGRSATPGPAEVVIPGFKYLMGNVSAAIGLVQLRKWPEFKRRRECLAERYLAGLEDIPGIRPLVVRPGCTHSWHLMIARIDLEAAGCSRDEFAQNLRQENIGTGVHFLGLHLHRYYRETLGIRPEALPEATAASRDIISLPLYPGMSIEDVDLVLSALRKVLGGTG